MSKIDVEEFDNDDDSYLRWIAQNPYGYVVKTNRSKSPDYMVLHGAYCSSISEHGGKATHGAFTERAYVKICAADVNDLRSWVRRQGKPDGSFSSECSICKPL